ncbi:glycosyl transferase, family 9 domain protein [Burkholderia cepacia]|nr:glycosyl transferase, family 9 domain protein [Burkholderia cepacia]
MRHRPGIGIGIDTGTGTGTGTDTDTDTDTDTGTGTGARCAVRLPGIPSMSRAVSGQPHGRFARPRRLLQNPVHCQPCSASRIPESPWPCFLPPARPEPSSWPRRAVSATCC